jgi:hypothetical protein
LTWKEEVDGPLRHIDASLLTVLKIKYFDLNETAMMNREVSKKASQ